MSIIYEFVNNINKKVYVGQTIDYKQRIRSHKFNLNQNKNTPFYNALEKYGWENVRGGSYCQVDMKKPPVALKIKDISNSFRLYKARKLKNIITVSNNFDIVEEIIYKLSKKYKNLKITEIPYVFKKRKFGKSKRTLFFAITYLITLLKLRFSKSQ